VNERGKEEEKSMLPVIKEEFHQSGYPKNLTRTKFDLSINKRLKEARMKKGYTLREVVNLLKLRGVNTGISTIQGYEYDEESEHHRYPSLHMILQLINLYGCSSDFIFGLSNEFDRPSQDLSDIFENSKELFWKGKEITEADRQMMVYKAEQIMSL
jgi:transcriptional regulator with XRE-family HTH domain